jgi:prepilin-type N-terminal cleavage/methylation domain-containing protein
MKMRFANQHAVQFPMQNRAGMTLVEVIVALAITGLTVSGIITGYVYCSKSTVKDALYMAANGRAMERIEATRTARWDPSSGVDELVASNFPDETVTLDMSPSSSAITSATIKTDISQLPLTSPVRRIRVDCIWQFNGGGLVTNTIETCRAPD